MEVRRYSKRKRLREYNVPVEDYIEAGDYSVSPIYKLPDHLFLKIFSYLSLRDRFRIQRVCKFWQKLSLEAWKSYKTLTLGFEDWGHYLSYDATINKLLLLRNVLDVCGPFLTCFDLSISRSATIWNNYVTYITSVPIFAMISEQCPNLTVMNFGNFNIHHNAVLPLFQRMKKLQELIINDKNFECSFSIGEAFKNNQNLRKLVLYNTVNGDVWKYLNSKNIEELETDVKNINDQFCTDLKNFINLTSICITNDYYAKLINLGFMEKILDSLMSITNIKLISFTIVRYYYRYCYEIPIDPKQIIKFAEIETLQLTGKGLNLTTEFFQAVGKGCRNLRHVHLNELNNVSDVEMLHIAELPKLEELALLNLYFISDMIFTNNLFALKKLHCTRCKSLKDFGLCEFIERSKTIEYMKIVSCKSICTKKIVGAIENSELHIKLSIV